MNPRIGVALAAALAFGANQGFHNSAGENGARPELLIRHRFARLKRGIGAPSQGKPAEPNAEKAMERREAEAMGMTGKQYRRYMKQMRRSAAP